MITITEFNELTIFKKSSHIKKISFHIESFSFITLYKSEFQLRIYKIYEK